MSTNLHFGAIDVETLATVSGGKSLEERAVAGALDCLRYPPQSSNSQEACIQEQRRRYGRAVELYGPTGDGHGGLIESRHHRIESVPTTYFQGE